jgi:hypothetical protein
MASITCPNCQNVAGEGTTTCPNCGSALTSSQATAYGASTPPPPAASGPSYAASAPPPPGAAAHSRPQAKFDLASIGHVERLVGGGTLVLFISLFLPWFSVHFGGLGTYTADGLSSHGYLYITLIVAIGILVFLGAEALGLWHLPETSPLAREHLLLVATGINFVLVLIGFLFKPGGSGVGWSWGAFVALVASIVAVFPLVWPVVQARRGK